MGQTESTEPQLMNDRTSYFAFNFKPIDRLQITNAAKDVVRIVEEVLTIEDLISSFRYKGSTLTYKIKLNGTPFSPGGGSSVDFKVAFVKILNRLYHEIHVNPFVSSDLCLHTDTSTVFFKTRELSSGQNYVCIGPSGSDSVDLIDVPQALKQEIINVFDSQWGIVPHCTAEKRVNVTRIELQGRPWGSGGGSGENSTRIRRLLLKLIDLMKVHQYRFIANISMKGTVDLLFFQYDPSIIPDSSPTFIMYLSKTNRIRFIDAPREITDKIITLINATREGGVKDQCMHNEALELKLKGSPWHAHSYDATPSRLLISTIFVEMRKHSTKCIGTLDISRRSDDKSVFIFETTPVHTLPPSVPIRWTCFYFCGRNKLVLIGVHGDIVALLNELLINIVEGLGKDEGNLVIWRFHSNVFGYGNNSCTELLYAALIRIYEQMRRQGWELVSSADVSSILVKRNDNWESYDAHSWFLINASG